MNSGAVNSKPNTMEEIAKMAKKSVHLALHHPLPPSPIDIEISPAGKNCDASNDYQLDPSYVTTKVKWTKHDTFVVVVDTVAGIGSATPVQSTTPLLRSGGDTLSQEIFKVELAEAVFALSCSGDNIQVDDKLRPLIMATTTMRQLIVFLAKI
jgi:hypothetical protein